jgi:hypothetical protein
LSTNTPSARPSREGSLKGGRTLHGYEQPLGGIKNSVTRH